MKQSSKRPVRRETGSRLLPLGLSVIALAACGAPPPPPPPPLPPVLLPQKPAVIAPPSATPAASATAAPCREDPAREEPRREAHGPLEMAGDKWLVERAGTYDARIWEVLATGPKLRARIEPYEMKVLPGGDRLAVDKEGELVIVELPTGKVHVEPKTRLYAATPDYLFVGDDKVGRRERAADFSAAGSVAWGGALDYMRGPDDLHVLAGGDTMAIGDSLVSFATGKVLARRLQFHAPRADGKRIAACDSASLSIVEVDAATGAIGARFPLRKPEGMTDCRTGDNPAYADDHTLFWFEMGEDTKDAGRKMVVCAGDTTTGKVTRFEEPSRTWSIGFASYPFVEEGRLCTTIASFHTSFRACDWALSGGRIVRSAGKAKAPSGRRGGASAGVAKPLCGAAECTVVGRFVVVAEGKIKDPLTGRIFELTAGEEEWAAVPRVTKGCR